MNPHLVTIPLLRRSLDALLERPGSQRAPGAHFV